ncbi:MAG TPA: SigE family RNA polymerase sigma factor [Actinomycetota bacterium]|jgi:RNA polymerase sigma-70 factor (sigma-E family)
MGDERTRDVTSGVTKLEGSRLAAAYERHFPAAVRLAYLLTGDAELAKDLAQDAFVKLSGRFFHFRGDAAFEAYLRQTVVNLTRSHARKRKVEADRVLRSAKESRPSTTPDPVERQAALRLLSRLTHKQRGAVVLRLYLDLSERETSELLGCKPGTVKSLLSRAMETLRKELEEEDDD